MRLIGGMLFIADPFPQFDHHPHQRFVGAEFVHAVQRLAHAAVCKNIHHGIEHEGSDHFADILENDALLRWQPQWCESCCQARSGRRFPLPYRKCSPPLPQCSPAAIRGIVDAIPDHGSHFFIRLQRAKLNCLCGKKSNSSYNWTGSIGWENRLCSIVN